MKTGFIFVRTRNVLLLKEIPTVVEALIPALHQIFYATRKKLFCLLLTPHLNGLLPLVVRLEMSPCQSGFHQTKRMEVARGKVRAVWGMFKNLPSKLRNDFHGVSSCVWSCIVLQEDDTVAQQAGPLVFDGATQFLFQDAGISCGVDCFTPIHEMDQRCHSPTGQCTTTHSLTYRGNRCTTWMGDS